MTIELSGNNNGETDQAMQAAANLRGHRNRMTRPKKSLSPQTTACMPWLMSWQHVS